MDFMDVTKYEIPNSWPTEAKAFAREAVSEILDLRTAVKKMISDLAGLQLSIEKSQNEIRELKAKLGTDSTNSHTPPSQDSPGKPPRETKPTGRKQGAQKGHPGAGRRLYPPERVNHIQDIFPDQCPASGKPLGPEDMVSLSFKPFHQIDLPEKLDLIVTEYRLHTCQCPCGCGNRITATMPKSAGSSIIGVRLKALMGLLSSRYHLSKAMIREVLVDLFGPDAAFSTGCISAAEKELSSALDAPYQEAREAIKTAEAVNVDETSWFLKHKLQWLWVAVSDALTIFYIDPNRSRAAFDRFLGDFEGLIISDRFSAYAKLSPKDVSFRQNC